MKFVLLIFLYGFFSQAAFGYANAKKKKGDEDGNTKLHLAIMAEDKRGGSDERLKKTVQALLQGGSDPNVMNEEGMTPLYLSAGYPKTFTLLLQYGADPNASDSDETDFQKIIKRMAAYQGKLLFVSKMLKWSQVRPDVNAVDGEGNSILSNYLNGFINRMSEISSKIEDFRKEAYNTRGYDERQSKFRILKHMQKRYKEEYKAGKEIASILINKGANLTYRNIKGKLPLHQAVQLPGPETARLMIKKRGTGYLTAKDRALLVRRAVGAGQSKTVRLLRGVNIFGSKEKMNRISHLRNCQSSSENQNDNTSIDSFINPILENHLDKMNEPKSDLSWKEGVKIAFILIESADLTYRNAMGELSLYKAVQLFDPRIAERMIQVGGIRYLSPLDREILISRAIERGHGSIISFLGQDPFDSFPGKSFFGMIVDKCLQSFRNF